MALGRSPCAGHVSVKMRQGWCSGQNCHSRAPKREGETTFPSLATSQPCQQYVTGISFPTLLLILQPCTAVQQKMAMKFGARVRCIIDTSNSFGIPRDIRNEQKVPLFSRGELYALTDVCLFYLLRNRRQTDRPLLTEVVRHATLLSRQIKPD